MLSWFRILAFGLLPIFSEAKVVELNDAKFKETIRNSSDAFFVLLYAPWCGHCKQIKPEWSKLDKMVQKYGTGVQIAQLDADKNKKIASQMKLEGFPMLVTIKDKKVRPYKGQRDAKAMFNHIKPMLTKSDDEL